MTISTPLDTARADAHATNGIDDPRAGAIGVLTIGQSPRPDRLGADIRAVLGPGATIVESGALDGLTDQEIEELAPTDPEEYHMVTLLRDGRSVEIRKQAILQLLQDRISDLENEQKVDATLMMCTGAFPSFEHQKPLLLPQEALYGAVVGIAGGGRIGDLIPLDSQYEPARRKWREMGVSEVEVIHASRYGQDPTAAVAAAGLAARKAGVQVLFMDCFGYDLAMKSAARRAFGGPVVLARTMAARLIAEVSE